MPNKEQLKKTLSELNKAIGDDEAKETEIDNLPTSEKLKNVADNLTPLLEDVVEGLEMKDTLEQFKQLTQDGLEKIYQAVDGLKFPEFPQIPEANEFPSEIRISNLKDIPQTKLIIPSEVSIKEPSWWTPFDSSKIIDAIKAIPNHPTEIKISNLADIPQPRFLNPGGGGGTPKVQSTSNPSITAVPVVNPDGSNISGGAGGGGGSVTQGTNPWVVSGTVTANLAAGTNVIGHVITDSGSVTNATLSAETTKVIGVIRAADGSGNLLTSTANALDINIKSGNLTTLPVTNAGTFAVQATLQTQTDTVMVGGVNIKEINAVAPLMGNGGTGTGSQRVTIASDNTGIANWGQGATGSAVPSGASYAGGLAQTALPTAATAGNLTGELMDKFGRQVAVLGTVRDLRATQTTTISASTAETTIVAAGAAGVFNDLIGIVVSNTSAATNTRIDIRDATSGSVIFSLQSPGNQTVGFALPGVSIPQTAAANNWTAQAATSTTDLRIFAIYEKNK